MQVLGTNTVHSADSDPWRKSACDLKPKAFSSDFSACDLSLHNLGMIFFEKCKYEAKWLYISPNVSYLHISIWAGQSVVILKNKCASFIKKEPLETIHKVKKPFKYNICDASLQQNIKWKPNLICLSRKKTFQMQYL